MKAGKKPAEYAGADSRENAKPEAVFAPAVKDRLTGSGKQNFRHGCCDYHGDRKMGGRRMKFAKQTDELYHNAPFYFEYGYKVACFCAEYNGKLSFAFCVKMLRISPLWKK
jgi:hypothetical protein